MTFCVGTDDFSQFCVEIPEVLRPQLGELVVTQRREDALDVLPVAADGGLRQLAGRDVRQPQVDVFCQRELLDGLRRVAAFPLKEDGLLVEPLFYLPGRQFLRRVDGFLLLSDALCRFGGQTAARLKICPPSGRSMVRMESAACSFCACWGWQ